MTSEASVLQQIRTDSSDGVKAKATVSIKWAYLAHLMTRALQPLSTVILARLLLPEDFGIIDAAMTVIVLADKIQNLGLGKALIQREGDEKDIAQAANAIFWSNFSTSLVLYGLTFLGAPLIGAFYNDPHVVTALRVMSLILIINSFDVVQVSLLQRDFQFKRLFWRRLVPALSPIVIGVPLAMLGLGYWALVYGNLVGSLLAVVFLWTTSAWRPRFSINFLVARQLLSFGWLVAAEGLIGWALNYADNAVVGHFLGTKALGIYALGYNVVWLVTAFLINPVTDVAYSTFSRLRQAPAEFKDVYLKLTKLVAAISLPVCLGMSLMAEPVVHLVLGDRWQGLGRVIQILAIMPGLSVLWSLNPEGFKAISRPDIIPKLSLFVITYMVVIYPVAIAYGLIAIVIARFSVGIVFAPVHTCLAVRFFNLKRSYLWESLRLPLFAAAGMSIVILAIESLNMQFLGGEWVNFGLALVLGASIYSGILWLTNRDLVLMFIRLARRSL
jgi:PST family polysaccharide transporter